LSSEKTQIISSDKLTNYQALQNSNADAKGNKIKKINKTNKNKNTRYPSANAS
jgi:hypothetical protein